MFYFESTKLSACEAAQKCVLASIHGHMGLCKKCEKGVPFGSMPPGDGPKEVSRARPTDGWLIHLCAILYAWPRPA